MYENSLKILNALRTELDGNVEHWLADALLTLDASDDLQNDLLNISARARRKCKVCDYSSKVPGYEHWVAEDVVRTVFVLHCLKSADTQNKIKIISDYYRYGDEYEKATLLQALDLLDPAGDAVNVAINACRANSLIVLNAIILHNYYPAKYFPELNWNQLVLKALFQGLNIANVRDLEKRQNATLSRMCLDYAKEQILAERTPQASIWLAIHLDDVDDSAISLFEQYRNENFEHQAMIEKSLFLQGKRLA